MDSKDDFNDMKLVDQFIPLEQLEYSLFSFNYSLNTNEQNQLVGYEVIANSSDELNNHSVYTDDSNLSNTSLECNRIKNPSKFPEPYAIMIVKAILSREDNMMQLKDIYNYFICNYEMFAKMNPNETKWKNSIRHNLSRHKYFIKTSEKNAQGHYWSIEDDYLKYFKQGIYDCKTLIKQAKLKKKQMTASIKKARKSRGTKLHQAPHIVVEENQSKNSAFAQNNDSAYMSNNETTDMSFSSCYYNPCYF